MVKEQVEARRDLFSILAWIFLDVVAYPWYKSIPYCQELKNIISPIWMSTFFFIIEYCSSYL